MLTDHMYRCGEDCLSSINHFLLQVCDNDVRQLNSYTSSPFSKLFEQPFTSLSATDVCESYSKHNNSAVVVYCREVDVEQPIFVLSFLANAYQQNLSIYFEAVKHIRSLHKKN